MGNQGSIPQEVQDRFATCELECMQSKFETLSKEGSFRGKTFDVGTFKRHYLRNTPDIAEMIFVAFDVDGNRKIDFEEFVQGISHCTRGSIAEKHRFAFSMFDYDKNKKISRKEFCAGIGSSYFGPKGESKADRKKRIEKTVNDTFTKYDTDKDGFLSITEFLEWAKESKEMEELLKLFNVIDNKLTASSDMGVAQPMQVTHDTHVGLTQSGAMTIDNIPPGWVLLFKQAGATDKELSNPELVIELMGIVAERLSVKANESNPDLSALTLNTGNTSTSPITPQKDSAPPTQPDVSAPATPPVDSAPPTPTPPTPDVSAPATPSQSSDSVNIPTPPSAAPPTSTSEAPANASNADLLSGIKKGVKLNHTEPQKHKPVMDKQSSLLAEIKQKPKLRHVDPEEIEKMSTDDRNDLTSVLARAIAGHRQKMNIDQDGNEVGDDDGWED